MEIEKVVAGLMAALVICMIALFSTVTYKMWIGDYMMQTTISNCPPEANDG